MAELAVPEEGNLHAFASAFIMIVVSEIGDKTFLIAAIMASRHPRITVFAGAFLSLVVMSVLSAALGKVILGFIPKVWTLWAAAALFFAFGVKMVQEARGMDDGAMAEEMREVEEELEEDTEQNGCTISLETIEEGRATRPLTNGPLTNSLAGGRDDSPAGDRGRAGRGRDRGRDSRRSSRSRSRPAINISSLPGVGPLKDSHAVTHARQAIRSALEMMFSPVFAQAFILTFLGEWGDRSQITTIAMAGAHSVPVIAFGTILGHSFCTILAVMGGRWVSTKLSVKHITSIGAVSFFVFAVLYAIEAYHAKGESAEW